MFRVPEYTSGYFSLYRIEQDKESDFSVDVLKNENMDIWYRENSVYDRTRYELEQGGKEITMKICIPQYKEIDSRCVCIIDGVQHLIYNAAHILSKDGFPETELTLIRPGRELTIV